MRGAAILVVFACAAPVAQPPALIRNVPPPPSPTAPRQPARVELGHRDSDGTMHLQTDFQLVAGMSYVWRIQLPCTGPVEYTETLKESAPSTWNVDPETKISADKTTATTHKFGACLDGWIEHQWGINSDDPPGEYVITVEIAGYATQTFRPRFTRFEPPP